MFQIVNIDITISKYSWRSRWSSTLRERPVQTRALPIYCKGITACNVLTFETLSIDIRYCFFRFLEFEIIDFVFFISLFWVKRPHIYVSPKEVAEALLKTHLCVKSFSTTVKYDDYKIISFSTYKTFPLTNNCFGRFISCQH